MKALRLLVYLDKTVKIVFLLIKKVTIVKKYSYFADIFSEKKQIKLNKHIIKLKKDKQLFYKFIYSLALVEFKILKAYIKIHLKTRFIQSLKSLANILILFNKKPDGSF